MNRSRFWRYIDVVLLAAVAVTFWRVAAGSTFPRAFFFNEGDITLVPLLDAGRRSSVPIDWPRTARHVVLRTSTTCPMSQDSIPFFRELSRATRNTRGVRFTVLSDQPQQIMSDWLRTNDVAVDEILRLDKPVTFGFFLLPTLLMVDNTGRVTDIVTDMTSALTQQRFVGRILDSARPAVDDTEYPEEIGFDDLNGMAKGDAVIIDVRERSSDRNQVPGTVRMPVDELPVRLRHEYMPQQSFVIDCRENSALACRLAARTVQQNGFPNVAIAFDRRP